MTHVRIFCTTLFTKNNIKVVIKMHAFQFDQIIEQRIISILEYKILTNRQMLPS